MLVVDNISKLPKNGRPVVLAAGCFDGVHTGHAKVIQTAVQFARDNSGDAWIYTFNPHPVKILSPAVAPELITPLELRRRQFEKTGAAGVIEIPFDTSCAGIPPEKFLSDLKTGIPALAGIVCGTDWSFGACAGGTFTMLEKFCAQHGIAAIAVPAVLSGGERISSKRIRELIRAGQLPAAEKLLGHPFCISGTVIEGNHIGRELGFPTINLQSDNELIPAAGVYAARARVQSAASGVQSFSAAVFIGMRKTFHDDTPVIEAHLLNFSGDLYGQHVELYLIEKIRDIIFFSSREALIEQIGKDIGRIGQAV
ncbi:MAG: riboflavin biosynthesis protein RibF [Kiritimatiellales bacterium]